MVGGVAQLVERWSKQDKGAGFDSSHLQLIYFLFLFTYVKKYYTFRKPKHIVGDVAYL